MPNPFPIRRLCRFTQEKRPSNFDGLRYACLALLLVGCQSPSLTQLPIWETGSRPVERISQGAGEGPAWHPEKGVLFSGEGSILIWKPDQKVQALVKDAGTNGLLFDHEGRLLTCEPLHRRVRRLESDGSWTTLTADYHGLAYNTPNDITVDAAGNIFFSDPRYGDRDSMEMRDDSGRAIEGVYCIRPNGTVDRVITHEVDRPNGVLVSADDSFLYVADNNNNQSDGARKLWRFDKEADGSLDISSQKLIFDWKTSRGPDGMTQDALGRIYVAAGVNRNKLPHETRLPYPAGIFVFSPSGEWLGHLPIPHDEVTNCAFGDPDLRTLYITAGGHLWTIRTAYEGAIPWPAPTP